MRRSTQALQVAAPAAGQPLKYVFAQNERVKLVSLIVSLTTSATVATRLPVLTLSDTTGLVVFESGYATGQGATFTQDYVISLAYGTANAIAGPVNTAVGLPWINEWMPPGWSLTFTAKELQAGDQFSAARFMAIYAGAEWDHERYELAVQSAYNTMTG